MIRPLPAATEEYPAPRFTRDYFFTQVGEFHQALTERGFWESPDKQDAAVKALGFVYLNTDHGDELESDAIMFEAAIEHFTRREVLILSLRSEVD